MPESPQTGCIRKQTQGPIPETFDDLTYLEHLDLHQNEINGSIPTSFGQLIRLRYLDLSENKLVGVIPASLGNLTQLTHFNLSYNNLRGAIPAAPAIQQFGASAFFNNPLLCGPPLSTLCNESRRSKVLSATVIIAIVAAALILAGVCLVTAMNLRAYRKKEEAEEMVIVESTPPASTPSDVIIGKLVLFSKSLPSRYEDWEAGTKALLDRDCLIGGGSMGTVYKATLEGGVSIAVKKLETLGRVENQDEFEQEVSRLGGLNHPNLVTYQGYYWSSTMQLILSEFIPGGSLYLHLHDSSFSSDRGRQLFWARRLEIALGTARALAYLHHDCKPQVLHLNIKSTNILLGEDYEAKLCDYGLGKLLPILGSRVQRKFHTAVGYVAPELAAQGLRYSDKCDVYSFGVILLEMVTGRKPVERGRREGEVVLLRDLVRRALEVGAASDCFDARLRRFSEGDVIRVLKLGLICTTDEPGNRPTMAEVVQFLETIRSGDS
ncbi:hypothetical protein HPP92_014430 [Vanilla planifolia]|uniref:Protein kinase domain-containing protein n=1 Tax=Vanilla planifolia TaxID=51239 RepID=A0A835QJC1_VANPL|nr:hypothetical protein HPP92_014430 [Vanilla planifolia]